MKKSSVHIFLKEFFWLLMIVAGALVVEFAIIYIFELHPVFKIKMQGFIGLLILGYGIRVGSRVWNALHLPGDPATNGHHEKE